MKAKPSTDRRVKRTRRMIEDAFLNILQDTPYPNITIIDIVEAADINRSTFYAHYLDKDDLLNRMSEEKLEALKKMGVERYEPAFNTPDTYFVQMFEHLAEHEHFYRVMFSRPTPVDFPGKVQEMIKESFYRRIAGLQRDQKLEVPLDILLDYIACSTQGIIAKWLENNRIYSPHYMALQLTRLSLLGVYNAMGLKERQK